LQQRISHSQAKAASLGQWCVAVQAGTFEERDVTEWAKQRLQELVVGTSSGDVAVTKCRSITGNANIWWVEGEASVTLWQLVQQLGLQSCTP
jgi:hypothetical protein